MGNQKYQCLLSSFKLFLPQMLINHILGMYNPALHTLLRDDSDFELSSESDQVRQPKKGKSQ